MVNRIATCLLSLGIHLREDAWDEFYSGCPQASLLKELTGNSVFRRLAPVDASAWERPAACFDACRAQTA